MHGAGYYAPLVNGPSDGYRPPQGVLLLDPLDRARHSVAGLSRLSRELLMFGLALLAGLLLVPLLIWLVGNRVLGPYTHGADPRAGPMALLSDFYSGLQRGYLAYWVVALGPLFLVALLRVWLALFRSSGDAAGPD